MVRHGSFPPKQRQLTLTDAVLALTCLTPFLVPFSLAQNIDLQALVLIMTGGVAWYDVWRSRRHYPLPRWPSIAIATYLFFCALSLIIHPSFLNVFGTKLVRLGTLELVACVGCGMTLRKLTATKVSVWFYVTSVLLAITTLPFHFFTTGHLTRLGGVFHQADILAVWMAIGFILGLSLWKPHVRQRVYIAIGQVLLATILLLSQTRAIIAILILIIFIMILRSSMNWRKHVIVGILALACIAVGVIDTKAISPSRITDVSFAGESITYRLSLQSFAVKALINNPLWGYGAGSLPLVLACPTLHNAALQATCHEGHYFDSSHNIFLDRFLAFGWLGGLAFATLVIMTLIKGLRNVGFERYFAYCVLLISLYYFTNVTSMTVELLLWVFMLRVWKPHKTSRASASR